MTERKWEANVLFDADEETAERVLDAIFEATQPFSDSAAGGLRAIDDLEAWENCRCGSDAA